MRILLYTALALCIVKCSHAYTDLEIVTLTILGEARGEGHTGMAIVADVIHERSTNKTPREVCTAPHQFDGWKQIIKNAKKAERLMRTEEGVFASKLAQMVLNREDILPQYNFKSFYAHDLCKPYWSKNKTKHIYKKHTFIN